MATATLDQTNLALHNRGASLLQRGDDFAFQSSLDEKNLYRGVFSRIGGIVLKNSTEELRECLQRAEECAQEAATLPDGSHFRQDFLELQSRWLELARSVELGEQLDSFTKHVPKRDQSRPDLSHLR